METTKDHLRIERRLDDWWIMGGVDYGPYDTKAEAEEDARGLEWFYRVAAGCPGGERCRCHKHGG